MNANDRKSNANIRELSRKDDNSRLFAFPVYRQSRNSREFALKKNKIGYTTGTCAQAAAKAACLMLIKREKISQVSVVTPIRKTFMLKLHNQEIKDDYATCCVIKKSPDEYDATDKAKICAKVQFSKTPSIVIKGGEGVGIVNKPGLAIGVGEHAINPVPRKMIIKEIEEIMRNAECRMWSENKNNSTFRNPNSAFKKGFEVTISVPYGEKLAKKTFNPKLGITGGISIIGTSGIVVPKQDAAYKKSLSLQLDVLKAQGHKKAVLVFGYVGEKYCKDVGAYCNTPLHSNNYIKIGDHIGFMLQECVKKQIKEVFLIGHIGKIVKIANNQFNTHIKFGDNRIKTIVNFAKLCGADEAIVKKVGEQKAAESTINILKKAGLENVFNMIAKEAISCANKFVNNQLKIGCIVLSLKGKELGSYPNSKPAL